MSESVFDIFGDHVTRHAVKNVSHQPLYNIENMGKTISTGPLKPNEPTRKIGEIKKPVESKIPKKSFLSNTGKALQSTPMRQVFTPRALNVGALIYTDDAKNDTEVNFEKMEFTKPSIKGNFDLDFLDFFEQPKILEPSPPNTPPPSIQRSSMEFDCSYEDDFFIDDFSNESVYENDLNLPDLY